MGICVNHPHRETSYMCSKHGIYQCKECLECRDPSIYCKFRSACPIWYEHKRKERQARQKARLEETDTRQGMQSGQMETAEANVTVTTID